MGKDIAVVAGGLMVPAGEHGGADGRRGGGWLGGAGSSDGTGLAQRSQRGMVRAEWAVGIVAAVAIAGVLLAVITSGQFQDALLKFLLWVIESFISVVS